MRISIIKIWLIFQSQNPTQCYKTRAHYMSSKFFTALNNGIHCFFEFVEPIFQENLNFPLYATNPAKTPRFLTNLAHTMWDSRKSRGVKQFLHFVELCNERFFWTGFHPCRVWIKLYVQLYMEFILKENWTKL